MGDSERQPLLQGENAVNYNGNDGDSERNAQGLWREVFVWVTHTEGGQKSHLFRQ